MLIKPQLLKKWAVCPFCGAKVVIFDNTSNRSEERRVGKEC